MTNSLSKTVQSSPEVCVCESSQNGPPAVTPWLSAHPNRGASTVHKALASTLDSVATMTDKKESCVDTMCHGRSNGDCPQTASTTSNHGNRKHSKNKGLPYISKGVLICVCCKNSI